MAGIAYRARIAAIAPAAAPLFAAIGLPAVPPSLTLGTVETALADEGANKVLTLEGTIRNPGGTEAAVPNLRIVVRDDAEQSLYSWTTPAPRARLAPGEAMDFRSRLVSPPPAGHDIVVSFAGQAEAAAPARVTKERMKEKPQVRVLFDDDAIAERIEVLAGAIAAQQPEGSAGRRHPQGVVRLRGGSRARRCTGPASIRRSSSCTCRAISRERSRPGRSRS